MWISEQTFFKVFKEHPDWFTSWVDEGKKIWNRETGEIICEDGTLMHDAVYRPPRDYNNYWKDCFQEQPKAYRGGPDKYECWLNADYVNDPELLYVKVEGNKHYKGKDITTGYWVYGPLYIDDSGYYIDDIEAGNVKVEYNSIEQIGEYGVSIPRTSNDSGLEIVY